VKVEGYNFDLRKHLLEYDEVINEQRRVIYEQRTEVLKRDDLRPQVWEMVTEEITGLVPAYTASGHRDEWDTAGLAQAVHALFALPADEDPEDWRQWTPDEISDHLLALAEDYYNAKVERLGADMMHQIERYVMLQSIDTWWIRHLTALDELRTGIGLRAFGQQDPLVTFKREGYQMYIELKARIREEMVRGVFYAEPAAAEPQRPRAMQRARAGRGAELDAHQAAAARPDPVQVGVKLGRNDPCWCGSGRKYKLCHMKQDDASGGPPPSALAQAQRQARGRR
jgi:preprotein translocase subunit SecA